MALLSWERGVGHGDIGYERGGTGSQGRGEEGDNQRYLLVQKEFVLFLNHI